MASSPEDSPTPPSPPPPSPNVSPPPPPKKESNSSPPPPPPPSSSPPPPAEPEESPPPPPPSSSSPSPSSSPPPAPGKAPNGTPSPPPPLSHSPTTPAPKVTPKNGTPTLASLSPPPPTPKSAGSDSLPTLPIVVGVTVGVALLFTIIIALVVAIVWNRKKKSKYNNQIQYYSRPSTSPNGGGGYGMSPIEEQKSMKNGYRANNDHLVINLPPPPGGNGGRGGWPQAMLSPQGQRPPVEMSPTYSVQNSSPSIPPSYPSPMGLSQGTFSYEELAIATHGFSQANVLGQGGFGFVHKGILPNSKEIAVKSLKSGSGQGAREFQAEVEIISRVHHRHLVSLVGYCIEGDQKMLVYEFVPNKTLEFHLHAEVSMDWPTRLKIALGAAKGLAYLHEDCSPRIIHRDIKSANILLDFNFEAQVADFGLAKLTQDNNTHVSTRVMGTFGYLAPEYASSGKLTEKSDVYSFGVVLLELITGRRPLDLNSDMDESLVDWARPLCASATEGGDFTQLVDPRLENNYDHEEMARIVACAGACIRHSARRRPKMRQIVRALEDDVPLDDLKDVVKPGKSSRSMNYSYDYDADMARFRKLALESHGDASSDFGNTSEYGLNPSSSSSDESSSYEIPSRRKP